MAKGLTIFGMTTAVLIILPFVLDMAIGIPFNKASWPTMGIIFMVSGVALGYLSWSTWRELD